MPTTAWMNPEDIIRLSELNPSQNNTAWFSLSQVLRVSHSLRQKEQWLSGAGGGGMGSRCLMGSEISLEGWKCSGDEGGHACTTVSMYLIKRMAHRTKSKHESYTTSWRKHKRKSLVALGLAKSSGKNNTKTKQQKDGVSSLVSHWPHSGDRASFLSSRWPQEGEWKGPLRGRGRNRGSGLTHRWKKKKKR